MPCTLFSYPRLLLFKKNQLSETSILKFSNEASASLSCRVMCSFHNQLLCDVTTEEQSKQRVPELERCLGVLGNEGRPLELEHGEQRQ